MFLFVYKFLKHIATHIKYEMLNYDYSDTNEAENIVINTTLRNAKKECKVKPTILMDSIWSYAKRNKYPKYLVEHHLIWVTKDNLNFVLLLFKYIRSIQKQEPGTLEKYVSFTRFSRGRDKISCDWCSIVNGCMELLLKVVYENINDEFTETLLYGKHRMSVDSILLTNNFMYHVTPKQKDIDKFNSKIDLLTKNKDEMKKLIHELLTTYEVIADIETRWCPFKHMTKLDFDRAYYKYNANDVNEFKIASDIIKKYGSIKCDNCIEILNKSDELNKNSQTIFADYIKHIEQILTI